MTLAVYNKETGAILMSREPESTLIKVDSILVDVPEGKVLASVDEFGNPVFEDKPLTLEQRLAALEISQNDQDDAITELAEIISE